MRRGFVYIIAAAAVLLIVAAAAEVSVQSAACMACHVQEASFARWMTGKLKAEKKGFAHELIACADCHIEGSPANTPMSKLRGLLHVVTYLVPQIDPRRPEVTGIFSATRIPTENCNYCHLAAVKRQTVYQKDLPGELKKIGLRMDHRKHVIARDDTCAKCHERYKQPDSVEADRTVTYTEVNHLACDSCHSRASHAYRGDRIFPMPEDEFAQARTKTWTELARNPRWMIAFPAEKACRKCHNGKIHYKTRIFLADCQDGTNFDDCSKCHPLMTKEYFEQHRKKRGGAMTREAREQSRSPYGVATEDPIRRGSMQRGRESTQRERTSSETLAARVPATR
ncbi:MAG: hypothetical protein RDU20_02215 [Desulfomonilaceae bacterium]|nr:hypothetical protein [Desulfomonilaceae bacterium]